jgi:hypothetical protein
VLTQGCRKAGAVTETWRRSFFHLMTKRMMVPIGLVVLAACGASELLGPGSPQGIEGLVLLGPMCPVVSADDPCPDQPYEAWIEVRNAAGGLVTGVRSGEDGRFRVGLRAGSYVLAPLSGNPFPSASEQEVVVREGEYTDVVVGFDTGIR